MIDPDRPRPESALGPPEADIRPLRRAAVLGDRAAAVGFDWPDVSGVLSKIDEERAEVQEAVDAGISARIEAEIGDLFFSVVNLCRHLSVDPEQALRRTNAEFERRFRAMEADVWRAGQRLEALTMDELEARWQAAKAAGGAPD